MKKSENVILIGMSGAGKSTLGVLLAKALGKNFLDTDLLIQQRTGRLLQEILDEEGAERFIEIERETVESVSVENTVIATGGSVVYSEAGMRALKAGGVAVYLAVDYEELASRLSNITTRGIVFKNASDLRGVYLERLPLYARYADVTVNCTGRDVEGSVGAILCALKERDMT
jgi:shikimate kinase